MKKMNIPVGISNFEKIRNGGFYYINKSGLIAELLDEKAEVTLITRPRRLQDPGYEYADIREDSRKLFCRLTGNCRPLLCDEWMNPNDLRSRFSFRQTEGLNFTDGCITACL